jgi:hypothetical protein
MHVAQHTLSVLNLPRRHLRVERVAMQAAEILTQADQFVLVTFVLPAQDLPQQGCRARAA